MQPHTTPVGHVTHISVWRGTLIGLSLVGLAWTVVVAITGGVVLQAGNWRLASRTPSTPFLAALLFGFIASVKTGRADIARVLAGLWSSLERRAPLLAAVATIVTLAVAVHFGSFVAGGSDSYCYVSQAELWAGGHVRIALPRELAGAWPGAEKSLVPAGYVPGGASSTIVPMCPPGLPLLMAAFLKFTGRPQAVYFVVPVLGAAAVWLTFVLGRRLSDATSGLLAAVLLATSPVFLYQVVQPMTDVAATAWWLACFVLMTRATPAASAAAGIAASAALLTRPNLLPLTLPLLAFLLLQDVHFKRVRRPALGLRHVCAFFAGLAPGIATIAIVHQLMYGSPLSSGYGNLESLFSLANVWPNARRYGRWMLETETPLALIALAAPFARIHRGADRSTDAKPSTVALAWLGIGFAGTLAACYLPYDRFEDWWYLRFLLPGLPILLALSGAVAVREVMRFPDWARLPVLVLACTCLASLQVRTASDRSAFALRDAERRYADAGELVARALPTQSVLIAGQQSGSLRYYSGRITLSWDALDPESFDKVIAILQQRGRSPHIVLEAWEEAGFHARFAGTSSLGALDWPPVAEVRSTSPALRVRVYDPADRIGYLAGGSIRTRLVP